MLEITKQQKVISTMAAIIIPHIAIFVSPYHLLYKYYIIFFIKNQLSVKRGVGQIALIL